MNFKYFIFILLVSFKVTAADPLQMPELFFIYSSHYDAVCANTPDNKIEESWAKEARSKTPEFKATWEKLGQNLFRQVFETFGLGFARKELTATLSVCPSAPSYSSPLTLNVTRFLKSYMGD
ncbi:MAG: hypothetical protein ACOYOK_07035, partial [Pseudobdellovibrionaceae bacterium]